MLCSDVSQHAWEDFGGNERQRDVLLRVAMGTCVWPWRGWLWVEAEGQGPGDTGDPWRDGVATAARQSVVPSWMRSVRVVAQGSLSSAGSAR